MTKNKNEPSNGFKTEKINNPNRKFAWMDKWIKMTGDMARIDAKANGTYIIYEKNGELVKEYPNGDIFPLHENKES
ncbi:hypothetical protein M948_10200 [Virgibacillus sp. CM-4]|uniref:hypothetical protein n=1 Tax=Virgibacillus sp. CM-4 TaxID=1354277 RepID=UPI0003885071|nr:hypothetical protein [Virgibacillus sp. CM-4]EQB37040.1 hypothetical protein M948_10200 [Virgibacillus sp. CM-4]